MSRNRVTREIGIVHPISDKNKLLWERYYGPMQAAAAQFNAAIQNTQNLLGAIIIEAEGFDPRSSVFDADHMAIRPRSKKAEGNSAALDE